MKFDPVFKWAIQNTTKPITFRLTYFSLFFFFFCINFQWKFKAVIVAEEVVVESSLSVRQKPSVPSSRRAQRAIAYIFPNEQEHVVLVQRYILKYIRKSIWNKHEFYSNDFKFNFFFFKIEKNVNSQINKDITIDQIAMTIPKQLLNHIPIHLIHLDHLDHKVQTL